MYLRPKSLLTPGILISALLIALMSCSEKKAPSFTLEKKQAIQHLLDSAKHLKSSFDKISLLEKIINESQEYDLGKQELDAKYLILNENYLRGNVDYLINHSEDVIDQAGQLKDYFTEVAALRIYGHANQRLGLTNKALIIFNKALVPCLKIEDDDLRNYTLGLLKTSIASLLPHGEERDRITQESLENLLQVSENHPSQRQAFAIALNKKAQLFMDEKQVDSAEYYFLKTISLYENDTVASDMLTYPTETLGMLLMELGRYEEATKWFLEALRISTELQKKHGISTLYLRLYDSYLKEEKLDSSNYFLSKHVALSDSLTRSEKETIPVAVSKFNQEFENTIIFLNNWIVYLITILLFLAIVTAVTLKLYRKNKKLIALKNLRLNTKKKVIKQLASEINSKSQMTLEELVNLARKSSPTFLPSFLRYFPSFEKSIQSLAAPNKIVKSEMLVCAYMKLNFDTKEIARYSNSSVRSIESKKYRIRKKLSLSGDEDLSAWMINH